MSDFAKEVISVNIEDELKQSYLSYALMLFMEELFQILEMV